MSQFEEPGGAEPPPLCACGLRLNHPGVHKVAERKNTLANRIGALNSYGKTAEHGKVARYNNGCRCEPCKQAESEYSKALRERLKQGITNKVIPADRARAHINALSEAGIGYKMLGKVAGVGKTILQEVRVGHRKNIREETERRILKVDDTLLSEGYRIDAGPTKELIAKLLKKGYAKSQIALCLGSKTPALQVADGETVLVSTAFAVHQLYQRLLKNPERKSYRRPKRRNWTDKEEALMREHYPHRPTKEVARLLKRTVEAVYGRADVMGLAKTPEYLASPEAGSLYKGDPRQIGKAHRFQKGQVPANKGLRRPG